MRRTVLVLAAFIPLAVYVGLVLSLVRLFDADQAVAALFSRRVRYSVILSLTCATVATVISFGIALPAAYALSRMRFPGRQFADAMLELPLLVSPAALGAMILVFFYNPFGEWVQHRVPIIFAVPGIILAQSVAVIGMATRSLKAGFDEVPVRFEMVARSLGATPFEAFRTITLPLLNRALLAAFIMTWAKAVGEFGATMMVAGTMAMKTETLPIAIFMKLSAADLEGAAALILLLIAAGIASLLLARFVVKAGQRYA